MTLASLENARVFLFYRHLNTFLPPNILASGLMLRGWRSVFGMKQSNEGDEKWTKGDRERKEGRRGKDNREK